MQFWQTKHADDPEWAENMFHENRDAYERADNYNVSGLFVFFALKLRQPFLSVAGVSNDPV